MFQESKKPNFFIVGAAKSGTTSLYQYLKIHKDVYLSPIKEPNFFSTDIKVDEFCDTYKKNTFLDLDAYFKSETLGELQLSFVRNEQRYQQLFDQVENEIAIGECSTSYLYSNDAAQHIFNFNPEAKIIVMLRNPVNRAFSHYLMALRYGYSNLDFKEAIKQDQAIADKGWGKSELYLELGKYAEQLSRYYKLFPKDQIKVYLFEDFVQDPKLVVGDVFQFLGVDKIELEELDQYNKAMVPKNAKINTFLVQSGIKNLVNRLITPNFKKQLKKIMFQESLPELSREDSAMLHKEYKLEVEKTSKLIGRNLDLWFKS